MTKVTRTKTRAQADKDRIKVAVAWTRLAGNPRHIYEHLIAVLATASTANTYGVTRPSDASAAQA